MRLRHLVLIACFPAFSACQMFASQPSSAASERLQGMLIGENSQLLLQPCDNTAPVLLNEGQSNLRYEVAQLGEKGVPLFVDLDGTRSANGNLDVAYVYRLEREGKGCASAREHRLILQAQGNEPGWIVQVQPQGLVLLRMGEEPIALPYLQEQLGADRAYFSSEANGDKLELWVAPQRCVDSMSGTLFHLSAELRFNQEIYRGCASYGGGRTRD